MNRRGPRQEHWGIPHITSMFLDFSPLLGTVYFVLFCYILLCPKSETLLCIRDFRPCDGKIRDIRLFIVFK